MSIELNWKTGNPSETGLHFVATKLGPAAGVFDFLEWDGTRWLSDSPSEVVAYATLQELKNSLDIKWPGNETVEYESKTLPDNDSELWSEG
jgi:hypothetical protein